MTEEDKAKLKPLTKRQSVFVDEYAISLNGADAARKAGYSEKGARQIASELLTNPNIRAAIEERFRERHMTADEALRLQADIARGDISELMDNFGMLDLNKLKQHGRLIKKIKQRTTTKIGKTDKDEDTEIHETEIELYAADVAQERILKVAGKFKEQVDITSGGEKIKGYIGWSPDAWKKQDEEE